MNSTLGSIVPLAMFSFTLTPSSSYHTCTGSNIFSQVLLEIYIHRLNRNWFVCCVLAPFIQSPPQYQGAAWLNRLIGSLPASASFSASPHVPLPLPTSTTSSQGRRIVPLSPLRGWRRLSFIVYKVQQKCTTWSVPVTAGTMKEMMMTLLLSFIDFCSRAC